MRTLAKTSSPSHDRYRLRSPFPYRSQETSRRQRAWKRRFGLAACARLEAELPEQQFNTWVRPLQAIEGNGALQLLAPNRFVVDWVQRQPAAAHRRPAARREHRRCRRSITVEVGSRARRQRGAPRRGAAAQPRARPKAWWSVRALNADFTFDTFVEGKSNHFAKAAALQVAEQSRPRLQPAVHLRRRRPGQDPPDARHRASDQGARSRGAHRLRAFRALRRATWCARCSTIASTTSRPPTAR